MDDRRKRLLYRATHRGTKESDAIVGGYFAEAAATLSDARVVEAEALLEESDLDLVDWIMGRQPLPDRWRGTVFDDLMAHYRARSAG
jgi:antitoxin CptB